MPSTTVGGAQGSGDLSYSVSCGNRTLASGSGQYGKAVSESVTFEAAGVYDITVVASNSTAAGPASSITVTVTSVTSGDDELIELPYNETFSTQSDFDSFSVIDVNKDGSTWVFRAAYNCALCQFSATNASDDYLVTRPVMLEKGKNYVLTCDLWRRGAPYTEAYRLVMGKSPDPKSLTTVLRSEQRITDDNIHKETIFIKPAETGIYYIAVHCVSPADAYGLCVDNLTISTGVMSSAPQAPAISVKPDFNGEKEATIAIVAPTTDLEGKSISKINSLTVRRDGEIIHVFDHPSPGETLTYKDKVVTDGYYSYEVYATNGSGNSHPASEKVFVGVNYAAPPTNVSIVESVDNVGTVTMKWNAPETDSDGNPINPDLVTYMIGHRMSGSNLTIVKRGINGTEYTFQALDPDKEEQKFVTYLIFSETDRGINDWTITQTSPIAVGKPYEMPYRETFGGDNLSQLLIATSHQSATWSISDDVADQDGDGSYLMYKGIVGATGTLTTAKVAVSGNSPVFSLWYMCIEDADDEIVVSVDSGNGNGFTDIASICIGDGDPYVWTKASVPLSDYVGRSVQIKLTYRTLAYRLAIDNLSVETPGKLNLSARGISVPYIVNPGVPFDVSLYVTNNGTENPGKFTSDLYRNGVKVSTITTDGLDPFESVTIKFNDVIPAMADNPTGYFAVVNCQNDAEASENITAAASDESEQLESPAPPSLTGQ
ncbi:MAG: hypothetical protein K2O12_02030, partial [Muribaculaceae bacterium]|nr:hypothetical protein [Muribaculaceae bacterium]